MFSKYEIQARVFPAIITLIPVLVLSHFYLYSLIPELFDSIIYTKIIGDISIALVLLYLVIQVSRFFSKKLLQDKVFKNELFFPTTSYLLYSDSNYSKELKDKIREKIKIDFSIELLNENSESHDENLARTKIKESVDLIRSKVKNGRLLLQHNIEYGFIRNIIVGTLISIPISILNIIVFNNLGNRIILIVSILLLVLYFVILLIRNKILVYFANNYAKVLFNEYLTLD